MLEVSVEIMEIFRDARIPKGGTLPKHYFESKAEQLKHYPDRLWEGLNELIRLGYIELDRNHFEYELLEAGHRYLYPNLSVSSIETEVLNIFSKYNIGRNQLLPYSTFKGEEKIFDAYLDVYQAALDSLFKKQLICKDPNGFGLVFTGTGYQVTGVNKNP